MASIRLPWRATAIVVAAVLHLAGTTPAPRSAIEHERAGMRESEQPAMLAPETERGHVAALEPRTEVERTAALERTTEVERLEALAGEPDLSARKRRFVALVLPLIQAENTALLAERRTVETLAARLAEGTLGPVQRARLERIKRTYGVTIDDPAALLDRVDAVPVSLALAQAAIESGWGTSRFARQANALYGQRSWLPDLGLVPEAHADEANFAVTSFASLRASIRAYMRNLNSHMAYAEFRAERRGLRSAGLPLDGERLAATLTAYSEAGQDYVRLVRRVLRDNRFELHDRSGTAALAVPASGSSRPVVQGSG